MKSKIFTENRELKSVAKRLLSLLLIFIMSLSFVNLMAFKTTEAASAYPEDHAYYRIRSKHSGYYLDLKNGSNAVENRIILKKGDLSKRSQIFQLIPSVYENYHKIKNFQSQLVLDLWGGNDKKDEIVIQFTDGNQDNQAFQFLRHNEGTFRIRVKHSGQFFTIKGDSRDENAQLVQWPYKSSDYSNQEWILEPVSIHSDIDSLIESYVSQGEIRIDALMAHARISNLNIDRATLTTKVNEYISSRDAEDIFSDSTGFVTTFGMLHQKLNDITFVGSHNAYSNNEDRRSSYSWDTYSSSRSIGTENQKLSIKSQLDIGYRFIDLDIGSNGNNKTGSYHRYRIQGYTNLYGDNAIFPKMYKFLAENPSEIIIIQLSEVFSGNIDVTSLTNPDRSLNAYGTEDYVTHVKRMLTDMKKANILTQIYNFAGDNTTDFDDLYQNLLSPLTDDNWPLLKDMITQNKRIFFIQRDAGTIEKLSFVDSQEDPNRMHAGTLDFSQETIDTLERKPISSLPVSGVIKLFNPNYDDTRLLERSLQIELFEDWGAAAGDINAAAINNQGRRLYDILTAANEGLANNGIEDKVVNSVLLDYVAGDFSQRFALGTTRHWAAGQDGGYGLLWQDVTPVDAVNRVNYDNFGYEWSRSNLGAYNYWD